MAPRQLVLLDTFSGDGIWSQWHYHFESVSEWDDAKKLSWLKVRLIGRAQLAFQRLPKAMQASYNDTKKALKERFV